MRIAVFRALPPGDMLCAAPALRALDSAYPDAEIILVGLSRARELAARFFRYVDAFVEFPGFPGMPGNKPDLAALPEFYRRANAARFDLAIQMHGSGELANPLTVLMGARSNAGFYRPGRYCPDRARFSEWREREHEVLSLLRLLERIGVPSKGTHLEFPLTEADWNEWRALRLENYVCLHPGARAPARRWPAERFAEVADALAMEGWRVVLTGTAGEASLTRLVRAHMREPALDLAGRTSLGGLAALVSRARLLVANDAGVSDIAAAMRTPSIIVGCGPEPLCRAPLEHRLHRVLHADAGVSAQEVLSEARRLAQCAA